MQRGEFLPEKIGNLKPYEKVMSSHASQQNHVKHCKILDDPLKIIIEQ